MMIKNIAPVIYRENTASENTNITVCLYKNPERILWRGKAKDLKDQENLHNFIVVEIRVGTNNRQEDHLPDYNKGKIIMVI